MMAHLKTREIHMAKPRSLIYGTSIQNEALYIPKAFQQDGNAHAQKERLERPASRRLASLTPHNHSAPVYLVR